MASYFGKTVYLIVLREEAGHRHDLVFEPNTVSPVRFRAGDLAAQDRDLVPEHQDFHVLGNIAAGEERQPAEQPDHEQIDEAKEHECRG